MADTHGPSHVGSAFGARSRLRGQIRSGVRQIVDRVLATSIVRSMSWRLTHGDLRVLAYHGVPDRMRFRQHLEVISADAQPVSLDQVHHALASGARLPHRAVLVTFDDGEFTVAENAAPELSRLGIPSVAFVVTGLIDSDEPYWWREVESHLASGLRPPAGWPSTPSELVAKLKRVPDGARMSLLHRWRDQRGWVPGQRNLTTDELRTMEHSGIEIAGHTRSHPCLDMCSDEVVQTEIRGAWTDLLERLGTKPTSFAYPNGNFDPRARTELASLGTRSAYLFDHRVTRMDSSDALALSRLRLDATAGVDRVAAILSGSHSALMRIRGR